MPTSFAVCGLFVPLVSACLAPRELRAQGHAAETACGGGAGGPVAAQEEVARVGRFTTAEIAQLFADAEQACARDGGALWGRSIQGPVLLVDPVTRRVAGNVADPEGQLVEQAGVFLGTLPKDKPIANAPVEWAGLRWAMVMTLFVTDVEAERVALVTHESFHCLQKELGLWVMGEENEHLETLEGRVLLQLEWRALLAALRAGGTERREAVADALAFRAARRATFAPAAERENVLELREGLASYTGYRLAELDDAACAATVAAKLVKEDGFARSFAYHSGPLYGYLLDGTGIEWRPSLTGASDLGAFLAAALALTPDRARAEHASVRYDAAALRAAEETRQKLHAERIAAFRARLVDGPVLLVDLALLKPGSTMNTRKTFPFGDGRVVYTERRHTAAWGTLELGEGAAILEDPQARLGRIALDGAEPTHTRGPGWTLTLAEGWRVVPAERAGDFRLERAP